MKTLLELYNSLTLETDKESVHSYITNFYEKEFAKYRKKKPVVVEVGVLYGGSIELAYNYFGDKSHIIGFDININPGIQDWAKGKSNVQLINSDAYNLGLSQSVPDMDIFIDDGPHTLASQKRAIDLYLPKVKSGGIFVIEDIQSEDDLKALLEHVPEQYKPYIMVHDFRKTKNRYDDIIIAVYKP